ncbi:MAG: CDP-alcohol phosphatidyltransferase family protein [Roseibacillus sp.]
MSDLTTTPTSELPDTSRRPVSLRASRLIQYAARLLARRGVQPNSISLFSIVCAFIAALALIAIPFLPQAIFPLSIGAVIAIFARGICNLLDGLIAIENNKATRTGAFFNEAPDRLSDALIFIGLGLAWRFDFTGLSAGLLLSLLAFGTAYIRALGKTLTNEDDFRGPLAKPHRIGLLMVGLPLVALLPNPTLGFSVLLSTLILGTLLTIVTRSRHLLKTLNQSAS